MTLIAIPLRSFHGLSRLSPVLDGTARRNLSMHMAGRVVAAARATGSAVALVTRDPGVATWAGEVGVDTITEPDSGGLDAAARAGVDAADGRPWVVLHADLPSLRPDDLDALLGAAGAGLALAPSHDGGTSAVAGSTPRFPFRYGPGSFRRHLAAVGGRAAVVSRPGLATDLDRPLDVERIRLIDPTALRSG